MTPAFLICFSAFLLALFFTRMGMTSGALVALARMFTALLSLFIALRYWFLVCRWGAENGTIPMMTAALAVFWILFIMTGFLLGKLRETYVQTFESVHPSFTDRALGALFGTVHGAVVAGAVMLTLTVAAPQFWPDYKPGALPLPIDRVPLVAYRFVETRVARVSGSDPAHTLLPVLQADDQEKPENFWK